MRTSQHFFQELQTSPSPYFRKRVFSKYSKPFTAKTTVRPKLETDPFTPNQIFTTRTESPLVFRDTLSNIIKDAIISNPSKKTHFNIKFINLHKKSLSSTINQKEIIKEFQDIQNGLFESNRNELKAQFKSYGEFEDDQIFIRRKEILIKSQPARFNLKLPETVDICRKQLFKKTCQKSNETIKKPQQYGTPTNISNLLKNHFKRGTYLENRKISTEISINVNGNDKNEKNNEYFVFPMKKLEIHEKSKESDKKEENLNIIKKDEDEDDGRNLIFACKSFGPSSPYFNIDKLHKRKTQKDFVQSVIQKKKTNIYDEPTQTNLKEIKKKIKEEQENYSSSEDEADNELKKDKKTKAALDEMNSKRYKSLVGDDEKKSRKALRKALKESLAYFASLKLDLIDLQEKKVFSTKPYEKEGSYDLISFCKSGEINKVKQLIMTNKYLVYDFDYVYLTGLHWAVKRGYYDIVQILINAGADLNAKDLIGRTPLFLAFKKEFLDIAKLLLYHKADPWSSINLNYNNVVKNKPEAKKLLGRARKLHILMKMISFDQRKLVWEKDAWNISEVRKDYKNEKKHY